MKMNKLFKQTGLVTAMALTLSACGGNTNGGNEDIAGIGGSGFVSSGTITGFGSVIVNGVRFNTDNATFDIEGVNGVESDLDVGMIVKVEGTINNDRETGTAAKIYFDDELQGPVTSISDVVVDNKTRTFTVLGTTVIIDKNTTTFDVDDDLPAGTTFDFDSITNNNNLEISGFFNTQGKLIATRVELEDSNFDATSTVEIEGTIYELVEGSSFKIGSLTINTTTANLDDIPNNTLADGQEVEVEGIFDSTTNTIIATKIEYDGENLSDTEEVEIEGIITDFTGASSFKVNGIAVTVASNVEFEDGSSADLANNVHVEIEGKIVDGVLNANKIEFEDGDIEVHAEISSIDVANKTFSLRPVASSNEITVSVSYGTQFENEVDANASRVFNISHLNVGDFVEVEGKNPSDTGFKATYVTVEEADDVMVQAKVQDYSVDTSIKVLGITFNINTSTEFEYGHPTIGALISITDEKENGTADGIADEIELESTD